MDIRQLGYALDRGLDCIIEGEPTPPTLPRPRELAPPEAFRTTELEQLLARSTLDDVLYAAVRPLVTDPENLLPGRFYDRLLAARKSFIDAAKRAPKSSRALLAGARLLDDERARRELLAMYRNALVAG